MSLALFASTSSLQQALYGASLAFALLVLGTYGRAFAARGIGVPNAGPWTSVYLGQFAALAALTVVMPLNRCLARSAGVSLPLVALVVPPAIIVGAATFRRPAPSPPAPLFVLPLASFVVVVTIYSGHLSALGLDLHEHLAWTRQIVTRGDVPLAEPGTAIVGDYPRTFHLVAAVWNAAGLAPPAGPFLKTMPFIQNSLPLLALAEQVAAAGEAQASRRRLQVTLALTFFAYAFLVAPLVYPATDLLGTPRYSSNGVLMLPLVLLAIARARQTPSAAALAVGTLPLVAAWALTFNPIVVVLFAVVTIPLVVTFRIFFQAPRARDLPARWTALAALVSAVLATTTLAQDPWVVGVCARSSALVRGLVHRAGLLTFDEAASSGLATLREKSVRNVAGVPPCHDARCVLGKAAEAAAAALAAPWSSARAAFADASRLARDPSLANQKDAFKSAFVMQPALIADYAGWPVFLWILAAVLVAARRSIRERQVSADARVLIAALCALVLSGMALTFAASLAAALNDQRHESIILAGYLAVSGLHVTLALLFFPLLGATLVLVRPILIAPRSAGAPLQRPRPIVVATGLAALVALPLLGRLNLHRPLQHRGFWTRIGLADLRALREVEEAIPPGDGVIIPAEHVNMWQWEHWVLPLGDTAALLPYGDRRYLFNVYLGASYPLSWRDITDRLCNKDPAVRAAFYRRTEARWVLIRDSSGAGAETVVNQPWPRICGVSFAALGAELPAVREKDGIFLFRLRPPGLEAQRPRR